MIAMLPGFTLVPQAAVAWDRTVSTAADGILVGSHCRGNRIPMSLFSAPVGRGINGPIYIRRRMGTL